MLENRVMSLSTDYYMLLAERRDQPRQHLGAKGSSSSEAVTTQVGTTSRITGRSKLLRVGTA